MTDYEKCPTCGLRPVQFPVWKCVGCPCQHWTALSYGEWDKVLGAYWREQEGEKLAAEHRIGPNPANPYGTGIAGYGGPLCEPPTSGATPGEILCETCGEPAGKVHQCATALAQDVPDPPSITAEVRERIVGEAKEWRAGVENQMAATPKKRKCSDCDNSGDMSGSLYCWLFGHLATQPCNGWEPKAAPISKQPEPATNEPDSAGKGDLQKRRECWESRYLNGVVSHWNETEPTEARLLGGLSKHRMVELREGEEIVQSAEFERISRHAAELLDALEEERLRRRHASNASVDELVAERESLRQKLDLMTARANELRDEWKRLEGVLRSRYASVTRDEQAVESEAQPRTMELNPNPSMKLFGVELVFDRNETEEQMKRRVIDALQASLLPATVADVPVPDIPDVRYHVQCRSGFYADDRYGAGGGHIARWGDPFVCRWDSWEDAHGASGSFAFTREDSWIRVSVNGKLVPLD